MQSVDHLVLQSMKANQCNSFVVEYRDDCDALRYTIPLEHSVGALSSSWETDLRSFNRTFNTFAIEQDDSGATSTIVREIRVKNEDPAYGSNGHVGDIDLNINSDYFDYRCAARNECVINNMGEYYVLTRIYIPLITIAFGGRLLAHRLDLVLYTKKHLTDEHEMLEYALGRERCKRFKIGSANVTTDRAEKQYHRASKYNLFALINDFPSYITPLMSMLIPTDQYANTKWILLRTR